MKTDYNTYKFKIGELVVYVVMHIIVFSVISILFYNSLLPVVFFIPLEIFVLKNTRKQKCKERQKQLYKEFNEMLLSLAANMSAGYALESSFQGAYKELRNLYQGSSYIEHELKLIVKGIEMNESIENMLEDFGRRSGLPDIIEFGRVVRVAKSSGGNLVKLIKKISNNISSKFEVENEINTMIAAKKMEQAIMTVMPFGIILYLRIANKGYMNALYMNPPGIMVMSICLIIIWLCYMWGRKIIDIRI
jgi:tight adherence protein B